MEKISNEARNHLQHIAERILYESTKHGHDIETLIELEIEWLMGQDYPLAEQAGNAEKLRAMIRKALQTRT